MSSLTSAVRAPARQVPDQAATPAGERRIETTGCDLVVIGGGPTGLYAAYYAGLRGLDTVIIDSLPHLGGQVATLYPHKEIYDIAGFPAVRGGDLIANLIRQLEPFPTRVVLEETVVGLEHDGPSQSRPWVVTTAKGRRVRCSAVVISVGAGNFSARRLPLADPYINRGVRYHGCSSRDAAGKHVVIVGGGDSAVDCALDVVTTAASVRLVHRSSRFRAHEHSLEQLRQSSIEVIIDSELTSFQGAPTLREVEALHRPSGTVRTLPADLAVVALGFITRLGPVADWGLSLEAGKIVVTSSQQTSLPCVFAVGDVAHYPGKVPLIATGFGEAATAVNNAAATILVGTGLDPGHSSEHHPRAKGAQACTT